MAKLAQMDRGALMLHALEQEARITALEQVAEAARAVSESLLGAPAVAVPTTPYRRLARLDAALAECGYPPRLDAPRVDAPCARCSGAGAPEGETGA